MDVGLPDVDGREAVRILRKNGFKAPIIMLTGHDTDSDTILGLESGANDYVTKPFRFAVLLARIRAQLRQHEASEDAVFTIGPYTFRPSSKLLLNPKGNKVRLTEKETAILRYLYRAGQRPVSRETLLQEVWGYNSGVTTHTLETHIYRLRQKVEKDAASPPSWSPKPAATSWCRELSRNMEPISTDHATSSTFHRGRIGSDASALSVLGRDALRILAIGAESRYIHSGEVLFNAAMRPTAAYVIQEGSFKLASNDGDELTVGPGTLLGELALFTETRVPPPRPRSSPRPCCAFRAAFSQDAGRLPGGGAQVARDIWRRALDQADTRDFQCARGAGRAVNRSDWAPSFYARAVRRRPRCRLRPSVDAVTLRVVAVTGTWSDGRNQPRECLRTCMPASRSASPAQPRCGRACGPCRPFANRASGSSTRCRAWPAPA